VSKSAYGVRLPFTKVWLFDFGNPKRGDVVVFKSVEASYFMIKRVIGLPGDKIEMADDGMVKVNGQEFDEKALDVTNDLASQDPYYEANSSDLGGLATTFKFYEEKVGDHTHRQLLIKDAFHSGYTYAANGAPFTVPEGSFFVMGDNRDNSKDSRYWGAMPKENLMGKALFIWLSCEETLPYIPFICNPLTIRWKRFFHVLE
jgi:signal peptidase I